ncbi:hypothetical protein METUNv1_01144 [Methyloversatilis universalis FAM5]|uniref:Lipoprotein n=1 Tax=Methyloversatilis universalis (strain ATCC BAA-1314 / DSM 25237 / JCM 13912 / CCUG 52030 / FAM5) TaxID=1000565 RepID=F5RA64_METUF|nr:hypothetical protein [Methyloversatilis universalis]EGK72380.1 hypothetical protein METUNv1_01144 [Methyloversatilis universalis FAM5]
MKARHAIALAWTLVTSMALLAGCQKQDGPAETAGRKIDEAGQKLSRDAERAGDKINEAARNAGDRIDKAGEKMQDAGSR